MTTATMPFKSQTISALKKVISNGIYEIPDYLSQECRIVIEGLLQQKPSQRLNLNDLRLTEWLRGQNFPNSLPKYELRIYDFNSKEQNNNKVCMSSDEKEAYKQLKDLGISDALIYDSLEKGSRSNVTGIFRIIMHRIINSGYQKNNSTKKAENINHTPNDSNININTNDSISNKSDTKHTKSSKSMSKSIKSLKNIFIDKPSTNTLSKIDDRLNANGNNSRPMKKRRKSRACCIL
jgi:serine/threonine-protein kinase NIM1